MCALQAARCGHAGAFVNLGDIYSLPKKRNLNKARKYFSKAVEVSCVPPFFFCRGCSLALLALLFCFGLVVS